MNLTKIAGAIALVAICWTMSACSTTVRYRSGGTVVSGKKHGPPPHAPAHGYRHKHGKHVLVYDSGLKVYMVNGRSNYYFHKKHYYRATSSGWEITTHFDGPWKTVSTRKVPKGLRKSVHTKHHKNKKK